EVFRSEGMPLQDASIPYREGGPKHYDHTLRLLTHRWLISSLQLCSCDEFREECAPRTPLSGEGEFPFMKYSNTQSLKRFATEGSPGLRLTAIPMGLDVAVWLQAMTSLPVATQILLTPNTGNI